MVSHLNRLLPGTSHRCPTRRSRAYWLLLGAALVDENYLPVVVGVAVVGNRVLRLLFSDGTAGDAERSCLLRQGHLAALRNLDNL